MAPDYLQLRAQHSLTEQILFMMPARAGCSPLCLLFQSGGSIDSEALMERQPRGRGFDPPAGKAGSGINCAPAGDPRPLCPPRICFMFCCGSAPEKIFHDSAETEHLKESFCAKRINAARCYGLAGRAALGNHKIKQRLYTRNLHSGISFGLKRHHCQERAQRAGEAGKRAQGSSSTDPNSRAFPCIYIPALIQRWEMESFQVCFHLQLRGEKEQLKQV